MLPLPIPNAAAANPPNAAAANPPGAATASLPNAAAASLPGAAAANLPCAAATNLPDAAAANPTGFAANWGKELEARDAEWTRTIVANKICDPTEDLLGNCHVRFPNPLPRCGEGQHPKKRLGAILWVKRVSKTYWGSADNRRGDRGHVPSGQITLVLGVEVVAFFLMQ